MLKLIKFRFLYSIAFLLLCFQINGQTSNSTDHPNIVYILADDLGIGDVSAYNPDSKIITPNIDRLIKGGLQFTDAHTSSAVCTPTRYGILTGRYNWRSTLKSGVLGGYSKPLIPTDRLTVGKLLQEKGYHTAFVGKWHLGWDWTFKENAHGIDNLNNNFEVDFTQPIENGPMDLGFTYSYGFSGSLDMPPYVYVENNRITAAPDRVTVNVDDKGFWREGPTGSNFDHVQVLPHLTQKAVNYIHDQSNTAGPFFLYFALPAPHTPILPTTEFMGKSNTNMYGDFMLQVDDVVGQVIQALENQGELENTILIFVSDNGCSPKASFPELEKVNHDPSYIYRGHKADIYEGGHRVPFIVHWPEKIKKAKTTSSTICTTDLMATVAELVNYKLPEQAGEDSFSFLPLLTSTDEPEPLRDATVHHSIDGSFAIRKAEWKLILCPGSGGWSFPRTPEELEGLPAMQLYNLDSDPGEEQNLIANHPGKVEELKSLLTAYVQNGRSTPGALQKNDGPETWKQLYWMTD
ncbi:sulfatase family protein [Cyclobacterium sp. SYSU L10401]|uniref:sulfatase family protein n=1 Tax=Cyclobacterium sp. SYSU L10401 TaxID=2678657 RepID=UPI0013D5D8F7|nr:arylsulfatase [Cyclobacterium sp. SYSU L10401]